MLSISDRRAVTAIHALGLAVTKRALAFADCRRGNVKGLPGPDPGLPQPRAQPTPWHDTVRSCRPAFPALTPKLNAR